MNAQKKTHPSIHIIFIWGFMVTILSTGCRANGQADEVEFTQSAPITTPIVERTDTPEPTPVPTQTPEPVIQVPLMQIRVPAGSAVQLDGVISPEEWDQAIVELYEDGSELLLMHAEGDLYLAIQAAEPGMIMANIFIQRGEEVSILHSSAALGTAKYAWHGGDWHHEQSFSWRCRDIGFGEAAQAAREEFLQQEGWLAANARMGTPGELEYQVTLAEDITSVAVIFIQDLVPVPFPVGLNDDGVKTYPQGLPETMLFSIEHWTRLELVEE